MSNKGAFKLIKNVVFLLFGIALLYLAFRGNDLASFLEDIRNAKYGWVIASMLLGIVAFIARGIRWGILLRPMGYNPRISTSIYSIIVGYLANLAFPRIGEITRCTVMNQAESIPVDKLFGTVILERIIDMFLLFALTAMVILFKVDLFGGFFLELVKSNSAKYPSLFLMAGATLVGVFFLLFALYIFRGKFSQFALAKKIRAFLLGLKEGLGSIRKIDQKAWFFFHTFIIWFSYYLMTWIVFYAIEETSALGWADGLFILVVGGFGMAAPVQGGIGAYHLIVSMGLGALGVEQGAALSYATIVHASQTITVLITGILSVILLSLVKKPIQTKNQVA